MITADADDETLIEFLNTLLVEAIVDNASDIHLEPSENQYRIRIRQQGTLSTHALLPNPLAIRLIARLKVLARLNITEKRLPQDGRFEFQQVDFRFSSCPAFYGEKIVLRILDVRRLTLELPNLGMTLAQQQMFKNAITQPQGLILATGPTGCGKTITLYAALNYLNQDNKNISTIEDPIEIRLPGLNQIAVHQQIGLDFADILRALLRQDPDIIMLGEIRDKATARIAINAAQTGHLVLATLHTNSVAETFIRMHHLGIASYDLIASLVLIINQRLVLQHRKRTGVFKMQDFSPELRNTLQQFERLQEILTYLNQLTYEHKPNLQMVW